MKSNKKFNFILHILKIIGLCLILLCSITVIIGNSIKGLNPENVKLYFFWICVFVTNCTYLCEELVIANEKTKDIFMGIVYPLLIFTITYLIFYCFHMNSETTILNNDVSISFCSICWAMFGLSAVFYGLWLNFAAKISSKDEPLHKLKIGLALLVSLGVLFNIIYTVNVFWPSVNTTWLALLPLITLTVNSSIIIETLIIAIVTH